MVDRRKRLSEHKPKVKPGQGNARKPTSVGTDLALTIPTIQGAHLDLAFWDLWFALVATKECGGELDRLAKRLDEDDGILSMSPRSVERKRCHLRDLQRRLSDAGLSVGDIITAAGDLTQIELRRARKRVLEDSGPEREWSQAMRDTPRNRRFPHALRGFWSQFPIAPEPYAKKIGAHFKSTGHYGEQASFRLARTLDGYADQAEQLAKSGKLAEAQALLRAWMTVVIELISHADDSCGSIGDSFHQGFTAYLKIPLDQTAIDDNVFFPDLLDFLVWEDYGLTNNGIEGYFQGITPAQTDLCIGHLRRQIDELKQDDLEYESEKALTLLGQLVAEQQRFDRFEELAREMGSREWKRIILLADRAMKTRKQPLACQVFEAALTKGWHLDFLTKKYAQLKRGRWSPDPRK